VVKVCCVEVCGEQGILWSRCAVVEVWWVR